VLSLRWPTEPGWVAYNGLQLIAYFMFQAGEVDESIDFVAHHSEIGSGFGGYNQDHEFFGYRQSI
ncbi:MAG: hypothetical protein M3P01_04270, partial [Actinomycetota bacterium]|nr:hypothetical protein [Actinomycetota bacterium]